MSNNVIRHTWINPTNLKSKSNIAKQIETFLMIFLQDRTFDKGSTWVSLITGSPKIKWQSSVLKTCIFNIFCQTNRLVLDSTFCKEV